MQSKPFVVGQVFQIFLKVVLLEVTVTFYQSTATPCYRKKTARCLHPMTFQLITLQLIFTFHVKISFSYRIIAAMHKSKM